MPVLTGYIDNYLPEVEADRHAVRITGRSKTEDIIDCTPDIPGGQFAGYKLDAIARAIGQSVGKPYPIDVVVQTDVGEPFPDATIERHETGFAFLERLCRLRSVLATDDEQGRLVLTSAGNERAHRCAVAGAGRQRAMGGGGDLRRAALLALQGQGATDGAWQHVAGVELAGCAAGGLGRRGVGGRRRGRGLRRGRRRGGGRRPDAGEDRGRRRGDRSRRAALSAARGHGGSRRLTGRGAMRRAVWQAKYNAARGTQARVIVPGWRQSDGSLWRINQLVAVRVPFLSLDMELLIAGVSYQLNAHRGRHTELTVGPVDGYQPDPGQVRKHRQPHGNRPQGRRPARTGMAWKRPAATRATRSDAKPVSARDPARLQAAPVPRRCLLADQAPGVCRVQGRFRQWRCGSALSPLGSRDHGT